MSVLRIAWRLDGSGLVQSMLATMAGSDVARNDRGMHTLGLVEPDQSTSVFMQTRETWRDRLIA
ncbi:hypothetical protein B9M81_00660 [Mycobacteroides abscessus]|nr:hypothetical protein BST32_23690 [Mycobacteroides abscessus subsp. massiliense]OTR05350.1 hypothetical protein B9M84_00450 [Mycobacteroides abscessus]OTR12467.1 hypothetical protein B9M83_00660 [Mycobacteroides abscessus]OTR19001.1 hypothetical protein B9M82_00580 [Mycobacteroides abscessus]OTR24525.1 hypothetical protein B9M81_00660 [Mycobacteroides abscessus]